MNAVVKEGEQELWSGAVQRRFLRRNYAAMALDGGFYFGGIAFVAPDSVLPAMLEQLGGPTWLVALAPTLAIAGFFVVPLFTAHIVERLSMIRPYVAWVSMPQRLPPLIVGIFLIFHAMKHPTLALWAVALSPVCVSIFGGANMLGFWEIFAKVIPARRRSSNMAARNVLGTLFGIAAGAVITFALSRWPGARGFGVLHVSCSFFFFLSLIAIIWVKEIPHVPRPNPGTVGLLTTVKLLPHYCRVDRTMRRFVVARIFGMGVAIVTPFLAIHALAVLDRPPAFLGSLVIAQSIGAIAGNLLAGWLGDRHGGRIVALVGGAAGMIMCLVAIFNRSLSGFLGIFFLLGASKFLWMNGSNTMMLELFPADRRPTYVAITSFLTLPGMLISAWAAGAFWSGFGVLWPSAVAGAVLAAASVVFTMLLPEPRGRERPDVYESTSG